MNQKKEYRYGMRLRAFSLGAQPMGGFLRREFSKGKYWDIIVYDHKLDDKVALAYDLDYLGCDDARD